MISVLRCHLEGKGNHPGPWLRVPSSSVSNSGQDPSAEGGLSRFILHGSQRGDLDAALEEALLTPEATTLKASQCKNSAVDALSLEAVPRYPLTQHDL